MWIIELLPAGLFHALIIIGALGLIATHFVKFIPAIYPYLIPIQAVSIAALAFGVYFSGVAANEAKWQAEQKVWAEKIDKAEEKAKTASARVEHVFIDRVQKVKDIQIIVQEKLKEITVAIDRECKVSPEAISLINAAAKNEKPEGKK